MLWHKVVICHLQLRSTWSSWVSTSHFPGSIIPIRKNYCTPVTSVTVEIKGLDTSSLEVMPLILNLTFIIPIRKHCSSHCWIKGLDSSLELMQLILYLLLTTIFTTSPMQCKVKPLMLNMPWKWKCLCQMLVIKPLNISKLLCWMLSCIYSS